MNRYYVTITVLLLSTLQTAALAGPGASGGGQGIVCRNDDGTVASAQVLDVVEAQKYFLLTLPSPTEDQGYLAIAENFAKIIDESMAGSGRMATMSSQVNHGPIQLSYDVDPGMLMSRLHKDSPTLDLVRAIDAAKKPIPGNDLKIPPLGDSHPRVAPSQKGCSIEQIALYTDGDNAIHIVDAVWNKLNSFNKAALLLHEAIYKQLRLQGDTNSDRSRKVLAYLLGGMKFNWVLTGAELEYLSCWTNDTNHSFQFVLYDVKDEWVTAQFLVYDGEVMLQKTALYMRSAPFAKIFGIPESHPGNETIINKLNNPLLDLPTYATSTRLDEASGKVFSEFEAVSGVVGTHSFAVECRDHLSKITYGADGSVSVGGR